MKNEMKKNDEAVAEPKKARRELLGSGLAAASMMFGLVAAACSDDSDERVTTPLPDGGRPDSGGVVPLKDGGMDAGSLDSSVPVAGDAAAGTDADIKPLNALLTAEYTAITAYSAGAGIIDAATSADALFALKAPIKSIAVHFQSQHALHAAALADAIKGLGGTPVTQATVAASFVPPPALVAKPTIINVLKFAASAERGAAVAYNDTVSVLEAARYRFLATIIEGDESQHFIVLTALVLGLAAPGPNLTLDTTVKVVPDAFVRTQGTAPGLDTAPADYFP